MLKNVYYTLTLLINIINYKLNTPYYIINKIIL